MVRRARVLGRQAALALACAAALACAKKKESGPPRAMAEILAAEPSQRARSLRAEMERLAAEAKYDAAAGKVEALQQAVSDIFSSMEPLHHRKTAVPDFDVIRYVEALRDLGENLRGFVRLYSRGDPASLKREKIQGILDQLRQKIR